MSRGPEFLDFILNGLNLITGTSTGTTADICEWVTMVRPGYQWYTHCIRLADVLRRVEAGEHKRVMVFMPPQNGKSELVSRLFSAWFLARHPEKSVGIVSYGADLAELLSRAARDNFRAGGSITRTDSSSVKHWQTPSGGGLWCAGVGGPITGKGFDCVTGDTILNTECGTMTVKEFIALTAKPKVLSFNHTTKQTEYRSVIATAIRPSRPLIEVFMHSGCRVRCTTDHLIYSCERGYTKADDIVPGETVIKIARTQAMRDVRNSDEQGGSLQQLLPNDTCIPAKNGVRTMWCPVPESSLRNRKKLAKRPYRFFLLCRMFEAVDARKICQEMPTLRQCYGNQNKPILRELQARKPANRPTSVAYKLQAVRDGFNAIEPFDAVLRCKMQERLPQQNHDGARQQPLCRRQKLRKMVQKHAVGNSGEGRLLRGMRKGPEHFGYQIETEKRQPCFQGNALHSSYRQRYAKQHFVKSHYSLFRLPSEAPQGTKLWSRDAVSHIERLSYIEEPVYDIQVEGNCNFFGNSVLLHNCGIIDDPFKNAEDASSLTGRDKLWDWYTSTFLTRQRPGAAIIIVQTRWHEDDLSGRLLADPDAGAWHIVNLPAIAEPEREWPDGWTVEPDWREPGEPLNPKRYPIETLEMFKRQSGERVWAALFQQRPAPLEGGLFKRSWFQFTDGPPGKILKSIRYWDRAATDDGGDYTVGAKVHSCDNGTFYVEDIARGQVSTGKRDQLMRATAEMDGRTVLQWTEQEPGSSGKDAAQAFVRLMAGFGAFTETHRADKLVRATPFSSQCEAGLVFLKRASWNPAFLEELCTFPNGSHDDQVDAVSGAFNRLCDPAPRTVYKPEFGKTRARS